jgi:hypothetical protein
MGERTDGDYLRPGGRPVPEQSVKLALLILGFEEARGRFLEVRLSLDADAVFLPLFEALSWTVSIDERLQRIWKAAPTNPDKWWSEGFTHGDVVKGVRFARNRVHHQWADALWPSRHEGRVIWRWRPTLPAGRNRTGEGEYADRVATRPAIDTLSDLSDCFCDSHGELGGR